MHQLWIWLKRVFIKPDESLALISTTTSNVKPLESGCYHLDKNKHCLLHIRDGATINLSVPVSVTHLAWLVKNIWATKIQTCQWHTLETWPLLRYILTFLRKFTLANVFLTHVRGGQPSSTGTCSLSTSNLKPSEFRLGHFWGKNSLKDKLRTSAQTFFPANWWINRISLTAI